MKNLQSLKEEAKKDFGQTFPQGNVTDNEGNGVVKAYSKDILIFLLSKIDQAAKEAIKAVEVEKMVKRAGVYESQEDQRIGFNYAIEESKQKADNFLNK